MTRACGILIALLLAAPSSALAQPDLTERRPRIDDDLLTHTPNTQTQLSQLRHAFLRLPLAAAFASVLALRPRRRGTPKRQTPVIQTQIILSVVGAVVMLVVGSSLARAFGIVGAAGLVRYRAKIDDPKDAGVMLSTLAVGLACGVGLFMLGAFATVFILAVLWVVESFEPRATQLFMLKVKTPDPTKMKAKVEGLLTRQRVGFELRSASKDELHYEVHWPVDRKTDHIAEAILANEPEDDTAVEWEEKKEKK